MNASLVLGALVAFLWASLAFAAEELPDDGRKGPVGMDEVVVTGQRLGALRSAAIKAEDRLLARYNELNGDHDLDIVCGTRTRTGTRLSQRYCMLRLQEDAQQSDASEFMTFMHDADVPTGGVSPLAETGVRLQERSADFRSNLAKLLRDNPDLRELVHQGAVALRQYEAERARRSGGRGRPVKDEQP